MKIRVDVSRDEIESIVAAHLRSRGFEILDPLPADDGLSFSVVLVTPLPPEPAPQPTLLETADQATPQRRRTSRALTMTELMDHEASPSREEKAESDEEALAELREAAEALKGL